MLVLSRRPGESVVIGDDVTISILEVRGDVVRVGIDAPRSVAVHRAELLAAARETNREAASPSEDAVASLSRALKDRKDVGPPPQPRRRSLRAAASRPAPPPAYAARRRAWRARW